jgi:regulatory protein
MIHLLRLFSKHASLLAHPHINTSAYSFMFQPKKQTPLTKAEAYLKAASFCAYQERCRQEVREKLYTYELPGNETEEILEKLENEKFLDEQRFARAFAGGKFRLKKWGKAKIRQELKMRAIPDVYIRKALEEINGEEYISVLNSLLEKKKSSERLKNTMEDKQKLLRFALSKGYEQDLIRDEIDSLFAKD